MPAVATALVACRQAVPGDSPVPAHERLSHAWVVLQEAKGNPRGPAFSHFNLILWRPKNGKQFLPGLWNCDGVKHWNVNPDAFDGLVETKTLEWLRDAVTSLGIVASAALPQSQFVQAGLAPVVYAPVRRPSVLLIEHPGFHSEGAACVIDYLANDLSVSSAQLKIINEGATYCEVVDKAVEWFESSHGAGHRGAFGNRMPGLWQDDLLGPLMSAQKALISMQEGEADHAVWDSGGKGRPPAKRAQLMDEHVALRFRLGKWARDMAERELEWIDE